MTSNPDQSSGRAEGAPITVKFPVGIMPAARQAKREPHLVVWSIGRHLAGRAQSVDRAILHDFVHEHDLFSRSRLNAIIREADGDFWIARLGQVSRQPVLRLRGLGYVIKTILRRCQCR